MVLDPTHPLEKEKVMQEALLVIDVQNEYFTGLLPISHPQGSLKNILRAMDEAHSRGMPIAVIQHGAPQENAAVFKKLSPTWELHPEVASRPRTKLIEKHLPGSFTGTDLEIWLTAEGVDTVVICGYMTHMCCDTTARQAVHRGFNNVFLSDATGTLEIRNEAGSVTAEELHRAILVTQAMRFSRVLTTDQWIESLTNG
jgi:nicotinamidase-related amidase